MRVMQGMKWLLSYCLDRCRYSRFQCREHPLFSGDFHSDRMTDNNGANAMHYNAWQAYANQEQRNIALFLLERN